MVSRSVDEVADATSEQARQVESIANSMMDAMDKTNRVSSKLDSVREDAEAIANAVARISSAVEDG